MTKNNLRYKHQCSICKNIKDTKEEAEICLEECETTVRVICLEQTINKKGEVISVEEALL